MTQPSSTFHNEQEAFWAGAFGQEYTERNVVDFHQRMPFFQQVLQRTLGVTSVCELGANKGHNLQALAALSPNYQLTGVEINPAAYQQLRQLPKIQAHLGSILEFSPVQTYDLVFTCGVLIHLNPETLPDVYRQMDALSRRYVLINEYYNPKPVEIDYRGHGDRLFKRDFAGEFLDTAGVDRYRVVDVGFLWQRCHPAWDNTTWVLLEKTN
ncbi:MAG: methyltransferase [Candidatus Melainabacteria bacterium]|nr:methyltransferase [Candidatus Melainabacteria bacterium]